MRIVRLILGAGLLISCLHFASSTPALAQAAPKWNILLLFADDQRADTIAALGNRHIQTPNLDRLAKRGVAFDRAYMQGGLNGATCVPSRAMLLSGKSLFRIDEKLMRHETWPSAFQRAGYTTFISGKWHNGVESIGKSFQQGRSIFAGGMTDPMRSKLSQLENGQLTNPQPEKRHACEAFSDEAIRFLTEHRQGPFFCYVPYDAPHDPHIVPDDFPIHYNPADLPLPANYQPQYAWDNGEMVIRDEKLLPWPRTPDAVREMLAEYYRYVSYLDMQIGRVLDALEASPHADRTLVVFCADSGVARGCHGLIGKQNVFEHSMRVPLIVAGPGIPANQRSQAMCYLFDLLPTLGALCGVAGPSTSEGINLAGCLTNPTQPAREQLMFAYRDVQRAVSDGRWKLVRYPKTNKTFLFDLANDPDEIYDLADVSTHTATVERLTRLLKSEQLAWGDQVPLEAAMPLQARWSPPTK